MNTQISNKGGVGKLGKGRGWEASKSERGEIHVLSSNYSYSKASHMAQ